STIVTIIDTIPPAIECPEWITVSNDSGECGAYVEVPLPATDNLCGPDIITNNRTDNPDASDYYLVGEWVVTYYAEDVNGNKDSCEVVITVEDTEAPVVDCPAEDLEIEVDENCE